jgi:hypothetical protein
MFCNNTRFIKMYIKMCPVVKEGIIRPVLSASVLKWFIRYIHYCHRWPWPILSFQFRHFDSIASKRFKIIWLSYHSSLSVANKGYYRNASRALYLISTFLFIITHMSPWFILADENVRWLLFSYLLFL